ENSGVVIEREKLLQKVWGIEAERENRTLDVHIRTLRSKLKDVGEKIQTVRGVGYKYIGEDQ
ncbi:MAG: winged helix-turn-helix domain-containing protein, partial [Lachnospiraceae bacterium]|nr:winged helix-turn-helix domain-containing protein [Lachnospiraceae bacterium]